MGKDTDYRSAMGHTSAYEIVEAIDAIAAAARYITSTYVEQIALVVITLHWTEASLAGRASHLSRSARSIAPHSSQSIEAHQYTTHLLDQLRPLVRKTDRVFLLDQTLYFLLPGANQQGGQIVQNRLWEALLWCINNDTEVRASAEPTAPTLPHIITIGHSAYPIPCADIDKLIKVASDAVLRFDRKPEKGMRRGGRVATRVNSHRPIPVATRASSAAQQVEDSELPVLARKLGIPYLELLPRKLPEDIQQLVNPKLAQELHCCPLGRERNTLTVAMLNPQDRSALDRLHQETGLYIFPVLTHPHALQSALEQLIC